MRHTWKTSPWTVVLVFLGVMVLGGLVVSAIINRSHRRGLEFAVTEYLDSHAARIAQLLSEGARSPSQLEDAIYGELQREHSISLVTRDMVRVRQSSDGDPECVIDISSIGMEPRRIRPARAP